MKDFLTADQTEQLKEKKWTVKPKGFWVELYKEDFTEMAWKDYCKIIGASPESKSINILSFAYASKND